MSQRVDPATDLTPIAKQICLEYTKTPSDLTGAAQRAREIVTGQPYANNNTAVSAGSRVLSRVNSRRYLMLLAAQHRVTPSRVFFTLDQGFEAERTLISPKGDVLGKEPDYNVRLRTADMSAKILGLYQAAASQGDASQQAPIDISAEEVCEVFGELNEGK